MSISRSISKKNFVLFPNPANESFSIETTDNEVIEVILYDLQGKVVKIWSELKNAKSFSILEIANGIYWAKIVGKNGLSENKKLCIFR